MHCRRGGSASAADGDLHSVTLMLNWTPNAHHAGIAYALEHGYYAEAGIDLEIIEPGADIGADAAVASGKAEFGISQAESLLPARASGMGISAIATLLPVNDSALMGLASSGLSEDPASLAGLTYGGYGGALETEIMSALTECGGGDPASIEFIDIGNVDYLAGMAQDRFDVAWVFGGWDALRAQMERDDVVVLPLSAHQDCIPNWYTPVIIGNDAAMAADPELTRAFVAATSRGYDAVIEDPRAGADALLAVAPELDASLVRAAVAYYAPLYRSDAEGEAGRFGQMDKAVWDRFTEFLVRAGMLDDASALEGAWTNEYLPAPSAS
ncbi:ABC transporter substrate-binding protein [Leucobacter insecticola]|uniref:Thiamine pyrimidine synthase n=1 Tax=Leucobacter insecticola TaxID=2714934 RepID=A0A6G8FIX9_9MICO|nr:ABC transporter substrate-binding protein [Leucobacter insecticola]QIM16327.1 ABC transporter substrate-binding protein [Leucobacter insecticola]